MTWQRWGVLSEDGQTYLVGEWRDGKWLPGSYLKARRERDSLRRQGERFARVVLVRRPHRLSA